MGFDGIETFGTFYILFHSGIKGGGLPGAVWILFVNNSSS